MSNYSFIKFLTSVVYVLMIFPVGEAILDNMGGFVVKSWPNDNTNNKRNIAFLGSMLLKYGIRV